jgi:hypothetical protein
MRLSITCNTCNILHCAFFFSNLIIPAYHDESLHLHPDVNNSTSRSVLMEQHFIPFKLIHFLKVEIDPNILDAMLPTKLFLRFPAFLRKIWYCFIPLKQKTDLRNDFIIQLLTKTNVSIENNNHLLVLQGILNSTAPGSIGLAFQDHPCNLI